MLFSILTIMPEPGRLDVIPNLCTQLILDHVENFVSLSLTTVHYIGRYLPYTTSTSTNDSSQRFYCNTAVFVSNFYRVSVLTSVTVIFSEVYSNMSNVEISNRLIFQETLLVHRGFIL